MGADVGWVTLNVGDGHTWDDWQTVRDIASVNGVTVYPWQRCFNELALRHLMQLAVENGVQPLPNLEKELEGEMPPTKVERICLEYAVAVVGWSVLGWLPNDVDMSPMGQAAPVLLQLFPQDMRRDPSELEKIQRDSVVHARDLGCKNVGVTYQTYGEATPEWYEFWGGVRSYYTGDDIGAGGWSTWKPE